MENEKPISPEESLQLISTMINKTKNSFADHTFYFLFWGWLVFGCCLSSYVMKVYFQLPYHYYIWFLMPLGGLVSFWYGAKQARNTRVKTFVDEVLGHVWTALGISFFLLILVFIINIQLARTAFTFYILLYAIGTYITGRIIRFRPLVAGGLINFALAIVSLRLEYDNQLLLGALAILLSYIIPGHLLRKKQQLQIS